MVNGSPFGSSDACSGRRIGLLSTYPPLLCGLATFAAALALALEESGDVVDVVRINDSGDRSPMVPPVIAELVPGQPVSARQAAVALSQCDVAIVQHEYGIYGGADGEEIVELLRAVQVPVIAVLHTVPDVPTENQLRVLSEVADLAQRVVVMSDAARNGLVTTYPVDRSKVMVIPHGAAVPSLHLCAEPGAAVEAHQLLTWGLIGPGKGIEHVLDALHLLGAEYRRTLRYTVAGVTHPKVLAAHGDVYRQGLMERAERHGLADCVTFDDTYRDVSRLTALVASSSLVVLPYDSRSQVTSGVLVDAIAAGRPVIATAFPHAVELLSGGAGIVVPHSDPPALANAIRALLDDGPRLARMEATARGLAPQLGWRAVAEQYATVADELIFRSPAVTATAAM